MEMTIRQLLRALWASLTHRPRLAARIDRTAPEQAPGVRVSGQVADSTYGQMGGVPLSDSDTQVIRIDSIPPRSYVDIRIPLRHARPPQEPK